MSGRDRLICWADYRDPAQRLSVFSTDGGRWLRGARDDLRIGSDGDFELARDEHELMRIAAAVQLAGPLGLAMEAAATLVVTSERLIVLGIGGETALGAIRAEREIHTFVLPWDLVDLVAVKVSEPDPDERSVELFCSAMVIMLTLIPYFKEGTGGRYRDRDPLDADEAFAVLVGAAAAHRLTVSRLSDRHRLESLLAGQYELEDGERVASITVDHVRSEIAPHLRGRLVDANGTLLGVSPRHRAAAALLLSG